jgi:uncharacterized protein
VSVAKKQIAGDSLAVRLLRRLARAICARPRWFVYPQILLFAFGVAFTVKNLKFDTSRNDLVGSDKKYHQNFLKFKKEFPTQDDLVVVVESELMEKNRQFVERLGAKLETETNLFADVFYKGDLKMLGHKALLFVPEDQLKELRQTLKDFRPFVERFTHATNLTSLFALVNRQFRTAKQERNAENDALIKAMPALERIIVQGTQALQRPWHSAVARDQCAVRRGRRSRARNLYHVRGRPDLFGDDARVDRGVERKSG